jgi:HAD superfamily hydrolase (TIGR01509 family)
MLKAIIFDLDGTLVNTYPLAKKVAIDNFKKHKIRLLKKDFKFLVGSAWSDFVNYVFKQRNIKPIDGIVKDIGDDYSYGLKYETELFEEAIPLLKLLSNDYKLALCSGSYERDVKLNINKFHLKKYFDVIVSYDDVKVGKPAPDIYLKTLEKLKLPASSCIGIEDSVHGIHSLKNARIKSIGITHSMTKQDLKDADYIVSDLSEIGKLINKIDQ